MELINVEKWGTELIAPDEPRHSLMYDVREGDAVIHWVGKNNPMRWRSGLYGTSIVAGELRKDAGEWLGRPANTIELTGYTALADPILLTDLRLFENEVLGVLERLNSKHSAPAHFPFHRHKTAGLKPNQRYLSKVPSELFRLLQAVRPDSDWGGNDEPVITPPIDPNAPEYRRRYSGVCMDPVLRKAIEIAAVGQATRHYEAQGFEVLDVGLTHSYDLRITRGGEVRHVEVKGSQGHIDKIQLTRNEVDHANTYGNTDLVVVREIGWERCEDGSILTHDGLMTVAPNWRPSPENLVPTNYDYFLD